MDLVTKSYLEAFRSEQSLAPLSESDAFEAFANYCVITDNHDEEFDVDDVHVGGGNDIGLDGIAILVNGALVTSVEEVNDLLKVNGTLDVTFIFVQAKSTPSFNGADIGSFFDGVDEFFAQTPSLPMNDAIKDCISVANTIYSNSLKFRRTKPVCRLFYVCTGKWTGEAYLLTKIGKRETALRDTYLFSEVSFTPLGADELHASYQRSKNSVTAEFVFANKTLLPEIPGVSEAYVGVIPATEFLRLLLDSGGNIRKSLFYDNIRDFQDYNPVNAEIRETLLDLQGQARFVVLNNGVTVVTRGLQTTGNKFAMTDYQIVNGCQTSHVLCDEKESLTDTLHVPLKVIATEDEDIINSIITSTNRQTQVTTEDLYALGAFQKKIEAFLSAYPDKKQLYYERRSKQYNSVAGIEKVRIITKPVLIRAFAAMFLDDAHRASRYYSDLRAQVGDTIFNESHKLEPYYVSAYAYYKLEFLFRKGSLPVYYKPARYHLLMAARYLAAGHDMPALVANKIQPYSNKVAEQLWDDGSAIDMFVQAIAAIDKVVAGGPLTRDTVKTQRFTDSVKSELGVLGPTGTVKQP